VSSSRLTALFTKRPVPGAVKTRLCPPLTPSQAAALAEAMLRDAADRLRSATGFRAALAYAPADAAAWFRAELPGLADHRPQRGDGLGARLAAFFEGALAEPWTETVVVIGSDQPLLGVDLIRAAHAALEDDADLVLAPDPGGGYGLVGLRAPCPELFTSVAMSTADMLDATLAKARAAGLEARLLETVDDVDTAADLARVGRALAVLDPAAPGYPRRTAAALATLSEVIA
jgi:rSAM/selenodomain-associated transferase 1